MLEHIFSHLTEQQKLDGEVDHPEFDPDYNVSGWPLLSDPEQRRKLESFVLRKCIPDRHRFRMANGSQGIVYFDARGRAVASAITEVPDADLVRLAKEAGSRLPGQRDTTKPQTGKKDHGYTPPVQEEQELKEERPPFYDASSRLIRKFIDDLDQAVKSEHMERKDKAAFLRAVDKAANSFMETIWKKYRVFSK